MVSSDAFHSIVKETSDQNRRDLPESGLLSKGIQHGGFWMTKNKKPAVFLQALVHFHLYICGVSG